jgi:hypothetical protein
MMTFLHLEMLRKALKPFRVKISEVGSSRRKARGVSITNLLGYVVVAVSLTNLLGYVVVAV